MDQNFEREVLDRLKTIEVKLDGYGEVKGKVYDNERRLLLLENELNDTKQELKNQQEESRWLKHTTVAAIITAAIGIVCAFVRIGIGI